MSNDVAVILGIAGVLVGIWMVYVAVLAHRIAKEMEQVSEIAVVAQTIASGLQRERDDARVRRVHDEAKRTAQGW
jgi:uncharacterized membrane protein (DUF106 family)